LNLFFQLFLLPDRNSIPGIGIVKSWLISMIFALTYPVLLFSQSETIEWNSSVEFRQEMHTAYLVDTSEPGANDVRMIAVDQEENIWIATKAGIYRKQHQEDHWQMVITGENAGPAYCVYQSGEDIWMGTWNGLYCWRKNQLIKHPLAQVVTSICGSEVDLYALGPAGVNRIDTLEAVRQPYQIARSIRAGTVDQQGHLWVATDVGIFECYDSATRHFHDTSALISAYVRGLVIADNGAITVGGLGGVSVIHNGKLVKTTGVEEGLQSAEVTCLNKAPDGTLWIGTKLGIARLHTNDSISHRFSRRWLIHDEVRDIAFDRQGNAWIATGGGVSQISSRWMSLGEKAVYFYDILMKRHIREPWIAGHCRLTRPGDLTSWEPEDDDNDGEYTGGYLAMESLRFAVTRNEDAREKAGRAFDFLCLLRTVTGDDGFFARTIIPAHWSRMHDPNRTYTPQERIEELVKEPRFKPVEERWRLSKDGKWLWKGDTSSDELCGHMMGYFYYYELAASDSERKRIRHQVSSILDELMDNEYNLVDLDGRPTRWGIWSPEILQSDPDWFPEQGINSFELLAFLKFGYKITGHQKYQDAYLRLIHEKNYLEILAKQHDKNPAWYIYFDVTLEGYLYPILVKYEDDPQLKAFYEKQMDWWFALQKKDQSALNNLFYCFARDRREETGATLQFLIDTPLDLIDWPIDHTLREDLRIIRRPALEELQTDRLVPPAMRATVRWDRNPWSAVQGNPHREREPVFWLFPYWLGRYLDIIH
jgi:hypothetical protein